MSNLKLCKDCKHCKVVGWIYKQYHCNLHAEYSTDPVTGKVGLRPGYGGVCSIERKYFGKCQHEGIFWESK